MAKPELSDYQNQHASIREEFKKQAASWGKNEVSPQLRWVVERLDLEPEDEVLDVAAGTGLLSRAISPHVKRVVALDLTPEMLAQGRSEVARQKIENVQFEQGAAERLPYADASFDMVATRFSVHHFQNPGAVVQEMWRVCCPGGSLVIIDIVSSEDRDLAKRYNDLERLRDPSHTRALSPNGLKSLVENAGTKILNYYSL